MRVGERGRLIIDTGMCRSYGFPSSVMVSRFAFGDVQLASCALSEKHEAEEKGKRKVRSRGTCGEKPSRRQARPALVSPTPRLSAVALLCSASSSAPAPPRRPRVRPTSPDPPRLGPLSQARAVPGRTHQSLSSLVPELTCSQYSVYSYLQADSSSFRSSDSSADALRRVGFRARSARSQSSATGSCSTSRHVSLLRVARGLRADPECSQRTVLACVQLDGPTSRCHSVESYAHRLLLVRTPLLVAVERTANPAQRHCHHCHRI